MLLVLWKLWCELLFDREPCFLSTFNSIWKDEVCHQWLAKVVLLIKDVQSLDHIEYSTFISA